jgi:hypothetical protein
VKAFLNAIVKKFRDLILDPVLRKLGLKQQPLDKPEPFNDGKDEIWVEPTGVGDEVRINFASGKSRDLSTTLEDWGKCAWSPKVKKWIADACKKATITKTKGKELLIALRKELKASGAKEVRTAQKLRKGLKDELGALVDVVGKLIKYFDGHPKSAGTNAAKYSPTKKTKAGKCPSQTRTKGEFRDDRPGGITVRVTASMVDQMTTMANSNIMPAGWGEIPYFLDRARGHLFAATLGGSNDDWSNFVTLWQKMNNTVMKPCEFRVRDAARCGEVVVYTVVPLYEDSSMCKPTRIHITAEVERPDGNFTLLDVKLRNLATETPHLDCAVPERPKCN